MLIVWTIMGNKAELTGILTAMKVLLRQQKVTQQLDLIRSMHRIKGSLVIFNKIKREFNQERSKLTRKGRSD